MEFVRLIWKKDDTCGDYIMFTDEGEVIFLTLEELKEIILEAMEIVIKTQPLLIQSQHEYPISVN